MAATMGRGERGDEPLLDWWAQQILQLDLWFRVIYTCTRSLHVGRSSGAGARLQGARARALAAPPRRPPPARRAAPCSY